jgi:hypothetical protein
MFSKACSIVRNFTKPVVILIKYFDGTVSAGLGSYIILNEEGWVLTVSHLFNPFFLQLKHKDEIESYYKKIEIDKNKDTTGNEINYNPKWIDKFKIWFPDFPETKFEFKGEKNVDIALGKISNFNPARIKGYPVFRNPETLNQGTSVCKIGFPFHMIKAKYDEENDKFKFDQKNLHFTYFPIDGIVTRNIIPNIKNKNIKYLETSSPGLRGQSGGPIFDREGRICALQSHTIHYPLGFSPRLNKNGKIVEENQFLNVGVGVHVETILNYLKSKKVSFKIG